MIIIKEVVTKKNNYKVTFDFDENSYYCSIEYYEPVSNKEENVLYRGVFGFNKDTKASEVIDIIKKLINKIENPIDLIDDLNNWDGRLTYDVTQEEKNDTLEDMLENMINALDDAGGLTEKDYDSLIEQLDKFKGIR
jgi:hypothetical protein